MIYDDYDELGEATEDDDWNDNWDDDWDEDQEEMVLVVRFLSSSKKYHYYTDWNTLCKGDKLLIRQYQNKETEVIVVGYSSHDQNATRKIDIIRKITKITKKTGKNKKENESMKKTSKAVENTKDAVIEAKDVAIKFQEGTAVITAIKTALFESDLVPDKLKKLIEAGNGLSDLVIGLLLQVIAETFTDSEIIQKGAKAANFSGAVTASSEFTMIQDVVENIVGKAFNKINTKTTGAGKAAKTPTKKTK